jgi:diguanylate cyclase (GGDEF)-like protein/PAS domain S-box-containing protein
MSTPTSSARYPEETVELAADALLREHPDGLVCGLSSNGLIVPVPQSIALWGQQAVEGRAVTDAVVAADRGTVVELWNKVKEAGASNGRVRLIDRPTTWMMLHFLDLQPAHGVLLGIVVPSGDAVDEDEEVEVVEQKPARPRFSTLLEDEGAKVLDCDEAFTKMFGFTLEEMLGNSVLDQIHPDDQGRAIEGWITLLSTRRTQQTRMRRKRKDGSWVWVDTTLHNFLNQPDRNYVLLELIDVSAEMAAQEALQEREELLRRLTDAMPDGLLQLDTERNVVYHNQRLLAILQGDCDGHATSASAGPGGEAADADAPLPTLAELLWTLQEDSMTACVDALGRVLDDGHDQDLEVEFTLPCGEGRNALLSMRTLRRPTGEVSGAITSVLDVTDSARARAELEKRATFDALTGAHNRSSILEALEREIEQGNGASTAVVYVDLDNFKPVNDTHGHAAGDELLVLTAARLREASRRDDEVGRLGGDEFIVLLRGIPHPEVAMGVAERICESMRCEVHLPTGTVSLQASVGVACGEPNTRGPEELIKRADAAMYISKHRREGLAVLDEGGEEAAEDED